MKSGNPALPQHLHGLLLLCWEKGHVPQDIRDGEMFNLCNKGDRSDCNNYLGVSLRCCRESLCSSCLNTLAEPCLPCVPRAAVWYQGRSIYSRHDLLTTPTVREVPWATEVIVYHIYRPEKNLGPDQQKWTFQHPRDASKTAQDDQVLSRGHAQNSSLKRWNIRCLPY